MKRAFLFLAALFFPFALFSQIREEYRPLAHMLATLPEREPTNGNLVELLHPGSELLLRLQDDILAAGESIHAEYFIFADDIVGNTIRTALNFKALDSLDVLYMGDAIGSNAAFFNRMKKFGVQVKRRPLIPLRPRNHQKLLLLDHSVGYTGGMNMSCSEFYDWVDFIVRLRGPVVAQLERLYARTWESHGGKAEYDFPVPEPYDGGVTIQSVGDDPKKKERLNLKAYLWVLENAREYFWAKTPYLKPPREFIDALVDAAGRGVDIRLMTPWDKDDISCLEEPFERVLYEELVDAGVHIYIRPDRYDHSKVFVTDDYLCATGSVNLDCLSLRSNFENNLYFYDEGVARQMKSLIEDDFANCYELTPEHIAAFPCWLKTFKNTLRTLGKLF